MYTRCDAALLLVGATLQKRVGVHVAWGAPTTPIEFVILVINQIRAGRSVRTQVIGVLEAPGSDEKHLQRPLRHLSLRGWPPVCSLARWMDHELTKEKKKRLDCEIDPTQLARGIYICTEVLL
jgi:hypothetical protein